MVYSYMLNDESNFSTLISIIIIINIKKRVINILFKIFFYNMYNLQYTFNIIIKDLILLYYLVLKLKLL